MTEQTTPTRKTTRRVFDPYGNSILWTRRPFAHSPSGRAWTTGTERVFATTAEYRRDNGLEAWAKAATFTSVQFESVTEALEQMTAHLAKNGHPYVDRPDTGDEAPVYKVGR